MKHLIEVSEETLRTLNPEVYTLRNDLKKENLSFITDKNLYKEIRKYLDATFSAHKSTLSKNLRFEDSVMKGSNSYIAVGVDMFLKKQNSKYRIATQRELETNLEMFKGCYKETGLALKSIAEPNKSQAENLYAQIKKATPNIEFPIFVDLRGLVLDSNLNFNLTDESKYKTAECLNWKDEKRYSKIDDFGLPKEIDKNSKRQIGTKSSGLLSSYLNGALYFNANGEDLSNSNSSGRVVLARVIN